MFAHRIAAFALTALLLFAPGDEDELRQENERLNEELALAGDKLTVAGDRIKQLEERLESALQGGDLLQERIEKQRKQHFEEIERERDYTTELRERMLKVNEQLSETMDQLMKFGDRIRELEVRSAFLGRQVMWLAEFNDKILQSIKAYIESDGEEPLAIPEEWFVTEVKSEKRWAKVAVGADEGVTEGSGVILFREGKYVGTMVVEMVGPGWCTGTLPKELEEKPVEKGDRAILIFPAKK